jgi:hypothetical protein
LKVVPVMAQHIMSGNSTLNNLHSGGSPSRKSIFNKVSEDVHNQLLASENASKAILRTETVQDSIEPSIEYKEEH